MKRILAPEEIPADVIEKVEAWQVKRRDFDPAEHAATLYAIFQEVLAVPDDEWPERNGLQPILVRHPKEGKGLYSKANLIAGYRYLVAEGDIEADPLLEQRIRMKPMRTQSGVAPVTVLTAPAGCPGKCIFCPDDWRMPKSYIFDEPGCQRAERDGFDPFKQTLGRIQSFESIGHDAGKVELLILGGTWSAYSRDYREWFVQRCFDAMNAAGDPALAASASLAEAQAINVTARHRNVGLVIETRPDWITPEEIVHLRKLGVTKVQIGVQSLDDEILALNKRGHDVAAGAPGAGAAAHGRLQAAPALDAQSLRRDAGQGSRRLCPLLRRPGHPPRRTQDLSLLADRRHRTLRPLSGRRLSTLQRGRVGRPAGRRQADDSALHARQPPLPRHPGAPHPGRRQAEQPAPGGA